MRQLCAFVITLVLAAGAVSQTPSQFRMPWLQPAPRLPNVTYVVSCATGGDLDGDGYVDILVGQPRIGVVLFRNDGRGHFVDESFLRLPFQGLSHPSAIDAVDIDRDGDLDLVVAEAESIPNRLWLNDGSGRFHDASTQLPYDAQPRSGQVLFDLEGDGDVDLIFFAGLGGVGPQLLQNDGHGRFVDVSTLLPAAASKIRGVDYVKGADFDSDGDTDLLFLSHSIPCLENLGLGRFAVRSQIDIPMYNGLPEIADFDGDGIEDAFFMWQAAYFRGLGGGRFIEETTLRLPGAGSRGICMDVDIDGDLDFLGGGACWTNDGKGYFTDHRGRMPWGVIQFGAVVGDFDADGDPDLYCSWYDTLFVNFHRQLDASEMPRRGKDFELTLHLSPGYAKTGGAALPLFSPGVRQQRVPPFGILGLDPAQLLLLPPMLTNAPSGETSLRVAIPADPGLEGLRLAYRALFLDAPLHLSGVVDLRIR